MTILLAALFYLGFLALVVLCGYAIKAERMQAEADAQTADNARRLLNIMERRHGIETPRGVG